MHHNGIPMRRLSMLNQQNKLSGEVWMIEINNQTSNYYYFDNRGTFHCQAIKTFHGDPNLGVLTMPTTTSTVKSGCYQE